MYVNLLNEAEGKSPIKKKDLNTKAQIDAYITPLNIDETEASKKRVEQINTEEEAKATGKLRKPKTKEPKTKTKYTVHFRVLTKQESKLQVEGNLFTKGKSKQSVRAITFNGVKYNQVGKEYTFETKNSWFMRNFKTAGTKNDIIVRGQRGEPGSRWRKTVGPVMEVLEEQEANHIISYMDSIYINKVVDSSTVAASDIKTEDKNNSGIEVLFNKFLAGDTKTYSEHEYLSKHFKPESCMLTCIIEKYWEAFRKRKSDGKRMFKENITYEYLCDLFEIPCTEDNISCNIPTALKFFKNLILV